VRLTSHGADEPSGASPSGLFMRDTVARPRPNPFAQLSEKVRRFQLFRMSTSILKYALQSDDLREQAIISQTGLISSDRAADTISSEGNVRQSWWRPKPAHTNQPPNSREFGG
jgi:hypothetical protein